MAPLVELDHVSKAYEQKVAVRDLNLRIEPGTMFGLLGPNGAGKTSSIRMMVGITVPDSGTVNLFGRPFTRESLKKVGYLPEERGLYRKMKVMDQLIFMGQLHGLTAELAAKRAQAWCERLQILDAAQNKTEELSKGMQQKIQFIVTLLHEPRTDHYGRALRRARSSERDAAAGHAAGSEEGRAGHPVLDPSHGPGGEAVRRDLPDPSGRGGAFRRDARGEIALRTQPGDHRLRRRRRVSEP